MKRNITVQRSAKRRGASPRGPITIGMEVNIESLDSLKKNARS
jgi:hypothetical protein